MGIRFHKSFNLAPGVRMNFSAGGISGTLGVPGADVLIGRRGARSDATHSHPPVKVDANIVVEDDGSVSFDGSAGDPLIREFCDRVNERVAALGQLHLHTPDPTVRAVYLPIPFEEPGPRKPTPREPGFFDRIFTWRLKAIEAENNLAALDFHQAKSAWVDRWVRHMDSEAVRRRHLEEEIFWSVPAMERHLEDTLADINWPRETQVSLDVSEDGRSVFIDVELPEIEELPTKTASTPGKPYRLSIKALSPVQVRELYVRHVHGIGFRILGETFAALPAVESVCLSAYTAPEEYLYSVRVKRSAWSRIEFEDIGNVDVVEALAGFELRRQMTKAGVFRAVEPFSNDTRYVMTA